MPLEMNIQSKLNMEILVRNIEKITRRTIGAKGNNLLQDKYCMTNYKANMKSA